MVDGGVLAGDVVEAGQRAGRARRRASRAHDERVQQPLQQPGLALVGAVVGARAREHRARDLAAAPAQLRQRHAPAYAHAEHHRHQQRVDVPNALARNRAAAAGRAPPAMEGGDRGPREPRRSTVSRGPGPAVPPARPWGLAGPPRRSTPDAGRFDAATSASAPSARARPPVVGSSTCRYRTAGPPCRQRDAVDRS